MSRVFHNRPKRLAVVFDRYQPPLYFVTICTCERKAILNDPDIHQVFSIYAHHAATRQCAVGRYVIMPDHIHLFVRIGGNLSLSQFVRLLKQRLTFCLGQKAVKGPYWQPGFFDHLLRSSDSYSQKWTYVSQNPVRAQLIAYPEEWPYQGEIVRIDRV
ncbi:MAG: transposase [Planctomycetes bacterium]|nr:transposase [Verrucomicrobiota bacterium]MBU4274142.1 transposase [Planctomycetota bacterium]